MPKSPRLKVPEASAPQTSFFVIGLGLQRNLSIFKVTGFVMPWRVSSPFTSVGAPFLKPASVPLYVAVGNLLTSNMSGDFACSFNFAWPKSIDAASTVTSTVPAPLSLSSTTVPEVVSNLPRQTDSPPMWSASKLG